MSREVVPPRPAPPERDGGHRLARPTLLVVCVANFLILLDTSIVNTAAPAMMTSLDTGVSTVLWVLNGYLLALAALLVVFSRLGDVLGPRPVFLAGLAVFTLATLLCGLAPTAGVLVAARVVQGVGAAALLPQCLVLISATFPPHRRGAAFGVFTAVAGLAAVSGPTLGGLAVTTLGWRWIFFLAIPVGVAGLVAAPRALPRLRRPRPHRFDLVGVLLATLAVVGLVYGLIEGERHRWGTLVGPVTVPALLAGSVLLLVAFVAWERRQREPLVPLSLFRDRGFTIATVITLVTSFGLYGFLLVFVLETQLLLGMTPLASGLAALPWTLTLSAVAPVAGRLTDRIGGRPLLVGGLAAYALGVLGVALLPDANSTATTFVLPLVLVGVGMGAAIAPASTEAMRDVTPDGAGAASGVLNTARQLGAALGAAVVGAVLQNRLLHAAQLEAERRAALLPPAARTAFRAGFDRTAADGLRLGGDLRPAGGPTATPADLAEQIHRLTTESLRAALLSASRPALVVVAVVLLVGSTAAAFLPRRSSTADRVGPQEPTRSALTGPGG